MIDAPDSATTAAPSALFVSWIHHHGRSEDLARELGARCAFIAVGRLTRLRTAPFRHAAQAVMTLALLLRTRPRTLLVMAPPAALVALGLLWARVTGGRLVVDCHSGAVLGMPLSGRLAARADAVIVTLPSLTRPFTRAVALHDPLPRGVTGAEHDEVVFPASWFSDEPVQDLLAAAAMLPHVRFAITGRHPADLVVPANVRLTGFLPRQDYVRLVGGARVVLALTTREATMQRAAYEAIAAGRAVVASDTSALRGYLGEAAAYAAPGPAALAGALDDALGKRTTLQEASRRVRTTQELAFAHGLAELRELAAL